MQDINELIKNADNDNLLLEILKDFITNLGIMLGQEITENELDELVTNNIEGFGCAFKGLIGTLNNILQGGGSGGSGGSGISINATLNDETTNSFEVIKLGSLYHITPTYFNVTYTNKTESDMGGFSVGEYDSSEHSFEGVIPCTYSDTNGRHTGVLTFNRYGFIMLYPSEDVTELNGDISIYTSGTLFVDIG